MPTLPFLYRPDDPPVIDFAEVSRYLGYGGQAPDAATANLIRDCSEKLRAAIRPRVMYNTFTVSFETGGVLLKECSLLLPGADIAEHLQGCSKAILFCATLSAQADRLIRSAQITDMASGLVLDCCATAAVEQLCDDAEIVMKRPFEGSYFTFRFSPGYGDLPLSVQADFLNVLDAPRKIGLCATDSSILTPRKSVTAVIGVSKTFPAKNRTGCAHCGLRETCAFRRKGEFCGLSGASQ